MGEHGGKPPYPLYAKGLCLPVGCRVSDVSRRGRGKGRSWPWGMAPYLFYAQKLCLSVKLSAKSRDGSRPRGKGTPRFSERRLLFGRPRKAKMSVLRQACFTACSSYPFQVSGIIALGWAEQTALLDQPSMNMIAFLRQSATAFLRNIFLKRAKGGYFGTATAPLPAKNARESAPASGQRGLFGAAPAAGGEWLDPAQADRPAGGAYRDAEGG